MLQEQANPLQWKLDTTKGSAFSPVLFAIMMDSLTENMRKKITLADDVRRLCGAVRKGEIRAGVGTGAVDGSLGKERK